MIYSKVQTYKTDVIEKGKIADGQGWYLEESKRAKESSVEHNPRGERQQCGDKTGRYNRKGCME